MSEAAHLILHRPRQMLGITIRQDINQIMLMMLLQWQKKVKFGI